MTAPALSPGASVMMQPVRGRVAGLTLAKHGILAPLAFAPPALWAMTEGAWPLVAALALPSVAGALAQVGVRKTPLPRDLRQVEALVTLALLFLLAAVFSVPALIVLGMPPAAALFEGMSAVTTTGLSMARNPDDWPFAAHVLRAWLQWCGGLVMVTAVLAFLLGPSQAATQMGRQSVDMGDRLSSTRAQARQLLGVYGGLTLAFAIPAMALASDWRHGLVLILSAISTGGFAPLSTSVTSYDTSLQALVIASCAVGAVSLLTTALIARGRVRQAWELGSLRYFLVSVTLALCALFILSGSISWPAIFNLLSAITGAGYSIGSMPEGAHLMVLFVVFMGLGGCVGSTSGGLKLDRAALIVQSVRHALARAQMPDSAVLPLRDRGAPTDTDTIIRALALLALMMVTTLAMWLWLMAAGYPAMAALFDTVSALATVGLSTGTVAGPDLPPSLALGFTILMWVGRLEFVAVLLLLNPRSWRIFSVDDARATRQT